MSFTFRQAQLSDLPTVLELYAQARAFMKQAGNPTQWGTQHPPASLLKQDIEQQKLHLCERESSIMAVFFFDFGDSPDPCYAEIDGAWHSNGPYGVIHRMAVSQTARGTGAAAACLHYCMARSGYVRIDTHDNNLPMQRLLLRNGFAFCGIIRLEHGHQSRAYDKISSASV